MARPLRLELAGGSTTSPLAETGVTTLGRIALFELAGFVSVNSELQRGPRLTPPESSGALHFYAI